MKPSDPISAAPGALVEPERQAAELDAMRRMIEASRGCFSLSVAICNSPALRDYLIGELQKSLDGLRVVAVPKGTVDVYGQVAAEVPAAPRDGLFVTNLEASVPSESESQWTLRSLNASRELWQERYACPVVFWLPEFAATLLAKHAPDFWRYRSHRFEFVSEQAGIVAGLTDSFAGDFSMAANLSAEEKRFRIAELEQRVAEAGDPPPKELARHVSVWLSELGFLYDFVGESEKAERMVRRALEIHERTGVPEGTAKALANLGVVYSKRGELDRAEEMHRRSLEVAAGLGWRQAMAGNYDSLGIIYMKRGDLKRAEEMHRKALEIEEGAGQLEGMAGAYGNLGNVYLLRGDVSRAEEMYCKSLAIDEKIGRLEGIARGHNGLGHVYLTRGDLTRAEEMCRKSLEISERLGQSEGTARGYGNLGVVYSVRGELDRAEKMHRKSLEINERLGLLEGAAYQCGNLGGLLLARHDYEGARNYAKKAIELFQRIGAKDGLQKAQELLLMATQSPSVHTQKPD